MNDREFPGWSWSIYAPMSVGALERSLRAARRSDLDPVDADDYAASLRYEQGPAGYAAVHQTERDDPYAGVDLAAAISRTLERPTYYVALPPDEVAALSSYELGVELDPPAEALHQLVTRLGFAGEGNAATASEPEPASAPTTFVVDDRSPTQVGDALCALKGWRAVHGDLQISSGPTGTVVAVTGDDHRGLAAELSEQISDTDVHELVVDYDGMLSVMRLRGGEPIAEWRELTGGAPLMPGVAALDDIGGARSAREILVALGIDPARYGR